jgi:ribosomal protein S18 acetylase RimI-like enzyme
VNNLKLHRATLADFEAVNTILMDAASWLKSRDIHQWSFFLTPQGVDFVRHRIATAETYLIHDPTDDAIATFTLQWKDEEIWGPRGLDNQAGYIHGLAVARRAAGNGLGKMMLDRASMMIAQNNRPLARLDCMAENPPLCDFYRRAGFVDLGVGESNITSKSLRLFECRVDQQIR